MLVLTIKQFIAQKGFTSIVPTVRENVNHYPFLTFINDKNEAENVYFSKKAPVALGQVVDKQFLSQYQIAIVKNAEGEERTKLISNSARVNIADLLD